MVFDKIDNDDWKGIIGIVLCALAFGLAWLDYEQLVHVVLVVLLGGLVQHLIQKKLGENDG